MKQPKKPTAKQKKIISEYRLQPKNWFVISEGKETLEIIHRHTSTKKILKKNIT